MCSIVSVSLQTNICIPKVRISQKMKGVIMRNLRDTIFYMKMNVLQDFRICISVRLMFSSPKYFSPPYQKVEHHLCKESISCEILPSVVPWYSNCHCH